MINKVILIGNVGADPEVRTLENGTKVARIRIATTERIYNRQTQESRDHTEWHSITLWRNLADFADRYVRKGSQVYIEGRLRSNEWTDANGTKRYGIEILADDMKILGRKSEGQQGGFGAGTGAPGVAATPPASQPSNYGSTDNFSTPSATPAAPPIEEDIDDLPF